MILSFYGMRRSGNHAILEWLTHSLGKGADRHVVENNRIIKYGDAYYLNEVNSMKKRVQPRLDKIKDLSHLIFAYEDESPTYKHPLDTSTQILAVVRDLPNLMASRHQKVLRDKKGFDMRMDDKFFNTWLEHANLPNKNIVYYDKWLVDKKYRDQVISRLGSINLDDTQTVNKAGGGSSFIGVKKDTAQNLLNRWQQVKLEKKLLDRLETPEIKEARRKLNNI